MWTYTLLSVVTRSILSFRFFPLCQSGFRNFLYLFPGLWTDDSAIQFLNSFPALIEFWAFGFTSLNWPVRSNQNLFRYPSGHFIHNRSRYSLTGIRKYPQPS